MTMPDCAFMTFYYNDGTKETVEAHTYGMALNKLSKDNPLSYHPFWQQGKGEGIDELSWVQNRGWLLTEEAKKLRNDKDPKHKSFEARGLDIHCNLVTKKIEMCILKDQVAMYIPGFDSDCTYITKEQAMQFFGLVERE